MGDENFYDDLHDVLNSTTQSKTILDLAAEHAEEKAVYSAVKELDELKKEATRTKKENGIENLGQIHAKDPHASDRIKKLIHKVKELAKRAFEIIEEESKKRPIICKQGLIYRAMMIERDVVELEQEFEFAR